MFFCLLYILSALSISSIAAYFSVLGLATIFPGSITSVIIMGGVLEVGKIVTAVWLHRNWKTAPFLIKGYLSFATLTLMAITSMGIFGFLSKAHIEHQTTTEKAVAAAQVIQNKIDRENDFVKRQQAYISDLQARSAEKSSSSRLDIDSENQKIRDITEQMNKDISFEQNRIKEENDKLTNLNTELQELENSSGGLFSNKKKKIEELKEAQKQPRLNISTKISQYNKNIDDFRSAASTKIKDIESKISSFRNQSNEKDTSIQPQIDEYALKISEAYGRIDLLESEKIGFSDSARQLEAEVGPVKYVAEAIADFTGREFDISQAVRIVIIILVLVFDPLAILLVIAANISIEKYMPKSNKIVKTNELALKKIESEIATKNQEMNDINNQIQSYMLDLNKYESQSKDKKQQIADMENESAKYELKLKSVIEEISEKEKDIIELTSKLESIDGQIISKSSAINEEEKNLANKEIELAAQKEKILFEKQEISAHKESMTKQVKELEGIVKHLQDEKIKESNLKDKLTGELESLEVQIEAKKDLMNSLSESYESLKANSDFYKFFESYNLSETMSILESGEKLVSIKGDNERVHQFLVPKQHLNLDHNYYHNIVKELNNIIDSEDLPHEYDILIQKYVRLYPPKYNVLT